MPSIVSLQSGQSITTDEDTQALADRFDASRRDGTLIRVDTDDGSVWINPHMLATIAPEQISAYEGPLVDVG